MPSVPVPVEVLGVCGLTFLFLFVLFTALWFQRRPWAEAYQEGQRAQITTVVKKNIEDVIGDAVAALVRYLLQQRIEVTGAVRAPHHDSAR